jgi:Uma2 family endonuclease
MVETPLHVEAIMLLHQSLEDYLGPTWLVVSDIFWYWEAGNADAKIAPDVMAVPEVGKTDRRSFLAWEEKRSPVAVFEMASEGTWRDDLGKKYDRYETLGVPEYFIFDPEDKYLRPRLQGYRLRGEVYRRVLPEAADGSLMSQELGAILRPEGTMLRLINPQTREPIPTRQERVRQELTRAEQEQARADREKQRADALQAEVDRLRAMLGQHGHTNGGGA